MTWRTPTRDDRQVAILWAVCAGLAIALGPVWRAAAPFLPPCVWHAVTGWPCPGCGSTRAMLRLLHADVAGALATNPLTTTSAAGFVGLGLAAPVWFALGGMRPALDPGAKPRLMVLVAAIVVANWVWLFVHGI